MKFVTASVLSLALAGAVFGVTGPSAHAATREKPSSVTPAPELPSPEDAARTLNGEDSDEADQASKPTACSAYEAKATSKLVGGVWSLKQRDDGQDWTGPWDIIFKADGSWTQIEGEGGFWCQDSDMIYFSFSGDPHTTYRGKLSGDFAKGTESWNGAGTGIFEIRKLK